MRDPIISRDAIATWMLNPTAGGRYLIPRKRSYTQVQSSIAVEYFGILTPRTSDKEVPVAPVVETEDRALYLFNPKELQAFRVPTEPQAFIQMSAQTDIVGGEQVETRPEGLLIVPLPLTEREVPSSNIEPATMPSDLSKTLSSAKVIHAVIDDTILPIHHRLRQSDGKTRFAAIWHQDGPAGPETYDYRMGRVWYRHEINDILQQDAADIRRSFGHDVRRETGQPTGAISASHGGAVLDLFSGYDPDRKILGDVTSDEIPIIGVQLPARVFWDSAGLALGFFISNALHFIIDTAKKMGGGSRPLVINFSYGMTAGPHDGSSFIEQVINQQLVDRRKTAPTELVLPIGNSHLERRSWRQSGTVASFAVEIPPSRTKPSFLEVWFDWPPEYRSKEVAFTLEGPGGLRWPEEEEIKLSLGEHSDLALPEKGVIGRVAFENNPAFGVDMDRHRVSLMLAATASRGGGAPTAPSGLWVLKVMADDETQFDGWLQRDDDPVGFPASTAFPRFRYPNRQEEYEQRAFTASAKVTATESVIAAGWRLSDGRVAPYSASYDPSVTDARRAASQLVIAAPSESSSALPGLKAAGNIGGRGGVISGTSAAAPLLARKIGELMARGKDARKELREMLAKDGSVVLPETLVNQDTQMRPGHVKRDDWLGTPHGGRDSKAWTGEVAEYAQARIGQGIYQPDGEAFKKIRRR
ncbi:hypothetical protein ACMA5I_15245 [Paracoccaceae bacterium GXU_MW_L88]